MLIVLEGTVISFSVNRGLCKAALEGSVGSLFYCTVHSLQYSIVKIQCRKCSAMCSTVSIQFNYKVSPATRAFF